jgi:hypothetical protein
MHLKAFLYEIFFVYDHHERLIVYVEDCCQRYGEYELIVFEKMEWNKMMNFEKMDNQVGVQMET